MQSLLNDFRADLLDLLTHDAKLSELLHTGYQLLGNPLMIFNHRGEVLSISEHQPYYDNDWEEAERSCYYAKEKFSQITSYDFSKGNPMLLNNKTSSYRSMTALIPGISSKVYLSMLESQHPFYELDNSLLMALANAIAVKLMKRKRSKTLWIDTHELFISNLLEGKILDENIAKGYADNFAIRPKDGITLITARSIIELGEQDIHKFSTTLPSIFPDCKTSIYKGDLIILVFSPSMVLRDCNAMQRASEYFRANQLQACVGIPVDQFLSLNMQYQNTVTTLDVCSKLKIKDPVIYYEHYTLLNLLSGMEVRDLELLCHPGVISLFEVDKQKGTSYIPTLYAYTLMFCNKSDAAKILNINSNTLRYRMKYIDTILGQDWEDISPTIYMSVKVLFILYPTYMKECEQLEQQKVCIRR